MYNYKTKVNFKYPLSVFIRSTSDNKLLFKITASFTSQEDVDNYIIHLFAEGRIKDAISYVTVTVGQSSGYSFRYVLKVKYSEC